MSTVHFSTAWGDGIPNTRTITPAQRTVGAASGCERVSLQQFPSRNHSVNNLSHAFPRPGSDIMTQAQSIRTMPKHASSLTTYIFLQLRIFTLHSHLTQTLPTPQTLHRRMEPWSLPRSAQAPAAYRYRNVAEVGVKARQTNICSQTIFAATLPVLQPVTWQCIGNSAVLRKPLCDVVCGRSLSVHAFLPCFCAI